MDNIIIRGSFNTISPNGHSIDIFMLNECLCCLAFCGPHVKAATPPNTFVSMFEINTTNDVIKIFMIMTPHQRYGLTIVISKCSVTNSYSVRASKIVFGDPSSKVIRFTHNLDLPFGIRHHFEVMDPSYTDRTLQGTWATQA